MLILRTQELWAGEIAGSEVKSTGCSSRGPKFNSRHDVYTYLNSPYKGLRQILWFFCNQSTTSALKSLLTFPPILPHTVYHCHLLLLLQSYLLIFCPWTFYLLVLLFKENYLFYVYECFACLWTRCCIWCLRKLDTRDWNYTWLWRGCWESNALICKSSQCS